jgi:hypothetical protein
MYIQNLIKITGKKLTLEREKRINGYKYNVIWASIKMCTVWQLQKEAPKKVKVCQNTL